jgi:hypothetical protein
VINPRSKKDEIKFPAEQAGSSQVLQRTSYLKHMKPVETSPDFGQHWQRSAKGARSGVTYEWFIEVEIRGRGGHKLHRSAIDEQTGQPKPLETVVVHLGFATPEQINNRREFWERFDVAMHNYLRWRTDYDSFGVIGRSYLDQLYSPAEVSKIVIVRRFRHRQELPIIGESMRPSPITSPEKVEFTERTRVKKRGKGIKPPSYYDKYRKRQEP